MGAMEAYRTVLIIAGMGLATYLPRLLPLLWLARGGPSRRARPPWFGSWVGHVPSAVLAALVLPTLLIPNGQRVVRANLLYLAASLPTALVAWRTRSLIGSVLTGVAFVALGRLLVP